LRADARKPVSILFAQLALGHEHGSSGTREVCMDERFHQEIS